MAYNKSFNSILFTPHRNTIFSFFKCCTGKVTQKISNKQSKPGGAEIFF
jgi:hypothetical protein